MEQQVAGEAGHEAADDVHHHLRKPHKSPPAVHCRLLHGCILCLAGLVSPLDTCNCELAGFHQLSWPQK